MQGRGLLQLFGVLILALLISGLAVAQDSITASFMEAGTYDVAAEALAGPFEEETGVAVDIVAFPWAVLRQNNTTDLLTGAGEYDVMSGGYYLADVFTYFEPLTDYIAESNYADGMIPGLMDPGSSEWFEGAQIGVPYGIDSYGLIVNTSLLEEVMVSPEFATWADFLAACQTIESSLEGVSCFSHSTGNPEQIGAFFFSGYSGTYINADGGFELEADAAVAAAAILPDLWEHLPPDGAALTFEEANQVFIDGQVAMLVTWPSFVSTALDDPDSGISDSWMQAPFPGQGFPWLSLWQMFIPKTTENKDAAWQFIMAFAGEGNGTNHYNTYGINSVWLNTYADEALAAAHAHQWPAMLSDFSRAKNPPLSGEAQDFLTNTLVEIATGQVSAEDGIARVNETWATIPVPSSLLEAATLAGFRAE